MGAHPSQSFRRPWSYISSGLIYKCKFWSVAQHISFSVFQDLLLFRCFRAQIHVLFFNSGPWSLIDCVLFYSFKIWSWEPILPNVSAVPEATLVQDRCTSVNFEVLLSTFPFQFSKICYCFAASVRKFMSSFLIPGPGRSLIVSFSIPLKFDHGSPSFPMFPPSLKLH